MIKHFKEYLLVVMIMTMLWIINKFFYRPILNKGASTQIFDMLRFFAFIISHKYIKKVLATNAYKFHVTQ